MSHSSINVTLFEAEATTNSRRVGALYTQEAADMKLEESHEYVPRYAGSTTASISLDGPTGESSTPVLLTPQGNHTTSSKVVSFGPDDPEDPRNWSKARKWYTTITVSVICFVVAFCSSVITAGIAPMAEEFEVSEEVALLSVSLFVVGFGVGPMAFAPLSEIYGRWPIYAHTLGVAVIFEIPCALANNITTLLVCRLIDGIAFSAPICIVGGTLSDIWNNEERGIAMAIFSAAPFTGPVLGPLVGGFLGDNQGWRWLYWIQLILSGVSWVMVTFTVPETYAPVILQRRAMKLRKETGDPTYVSILQLKSNNWRDLVRTHLFRPFILYTEPIVLLFSLYMSVLYGILYIFFVSFPVIFQEGKGYTASKTGLMFLPLLGGLVIGLAMVPFINKHYLQRVRAYQGPGLPPPEFRLYGMLIGCVFLPLGIFISAWTSYPRLNGAGPAMGGLPMGLGFVLIYNSANNYIVDAYQHVAASALAAKTLMRSLWGAACVMFTVQMMHRLGSQWALSLIAFIALAFCPVPWLFYFYGARIRQRSKYAYYASKEPKEVEV